MALISCEACNNEISQLAASCPNCGHPNHQDLNTQPKKKNLTIEQTSKKYKASKLIGGLAVLLGFVFIGSSPALGASFLAIGLTVYVYGRFGAWWNNE